VFDFEPGWPLGDVNFQIAPFKKGQRRLFTQMDGLADAQIQCSYADRNGYLWFGTFSGLTRYDGRSFVNLGPEDGLAGVSVNAICADQTGALWVGTEHGLSCYQRGRFVKSAVQEKLGDKAVQAILSDAKGTLWFGTWHQGLWRYDGTELSKVPILDLSETSITWLQEAEDGSIWFRKQAGADRWDGINCLSFTRTNGFTGAQVTCACRGSVGALWFGTAGDGAYCYDGRSFKHFTKAQGLAGDSVNSIHHDADGLLWFATNEGVSRYNGEGFVNLTPEDGFDHCLDERRATR
jgi:ligand-binding sensor domain-containing protein